MGSRVNYVVIHDGQHTVYAQGGGSGDSIDYNFAVGPDVVLRWLANAADYATGHWFDDVLCKGGVLIDTDLKVLMLFNTTSNELAYRAAMLRAYAATWPGWEIRWAYDGIADLMAYVGADPEKARDHDPRPEPSSHNEFAPDDPASAIVTITGTDGTTRIYGLNPDLAWRRWDMGSGLIDWITAGPELPDTCDDLPTAGLDLDLATRRAGLWSVEPLCGLRDRWDTLWPGWTLEFWGDDFARQAVRDPERLYDSIGPRAIDRDRRELTERVQDYWPVRSTMLAKGVDVAWIHESNIGGMGSQLDAGVTADEIERIVTLLRGPQTTA